MINNLNTIVILIGKEDILIEVDNIYDCLWVSTKQIVQKLFNTYLNNSLSCYVDIRFSNSLISTILSTIHLPIFLNNICMGHTCLIKSFEVSHIVKEMFFRYIHFQFLIVFKSKAVDDFLHCWSLKALRASICFIRTSTNIDTEDIACTTTPYLCLSDCRPVTLVLHTEIPILLQHGIPKINSNIFIVTIKAVLLNQRKETSCTQCQMIVVLFLPVRHATHTDLKSAMVSYFEFILIKLMFDKFHKIYYR